MKKEKEIRVYVKRDKRYWNGDHYLNWVGYVLLLVFLWAMIMAWTNRHPLVSPIVVGPVPQVLASETIVIPCEKGVAEYLECQVIKGEITEKEARVMLAIAKAESGLKEKAKNKVSSAKGVFQILSGSTWHDYGCKGEIYEWKDNTKCALKIMHRSGFTPWEVYNTGSYKKFL